MSFALPSLARVRQNDLTLGRLITGRSIEDYFIAPLAPRRYRYYVPGRERSGHLYLLGKTGVGKSTCMVDLLLQDITNFRGCGVIDPHSDLVYSVLSLMESRGLLRDPHQSSRIVYVNPRDDTYAPAFNVLAVSDPTDKRAIYQLAKEIIEAFRRAWPTSLAEDSSPQFTGIMLYSLPVLIKARLSLVELDRFLLDEDFRDSLLETYGDEDEKRFFQLRVKAWGRKEMVLRMESTNNKLSPLTRDPDLKRMLGAKTNAMNFREMMDTGKVFLADVGGCDYLLPSLMTTFFQLAAMSRINLPPEERRAFYLFVDEFHDFSVGWGSDKTFSKILSGARKFGLHLHLAHQHLDQLSDKMKKAIFGNVWTKVVFGVSEYDADDLAHVMGLGYFDTEAVKREAQTEVQHPAWKSLYEQQSELAAQLATQQQAHATVRNNAGVKAEIFTNPVEQVRRVSQDQIRQYLTAYELANDRSQTVFEAGIERRGQSVHHAGEIPVSDAL